MNPTNKHYLSVIDSKNMIKIQIHAYDDIGPFYLHIDKRAIPDLITQLEHFRVKE
jgi:hypothetical protein